MGLSLIDPVIPLPELYPSHSLNYGLLVPALADHSARDRLAAKNIAIPGPNGAVYTLHGVKIILKSTLTTTVCTGGLFEFENDSVDWKPFEVYPNTSSGAGANVGAALSETTIACNKPLPAGSNVTVYYTALNAAVDMPIVVLIYSEKPFSGRQTLIKSSIGAAITQITNAAGHCTITVPANKGGKLIGFYAQVYGTIETVVVGGGMVIVRNASCKPSLEPCEFTTGGLSTIGTGGGELLLTRHKHVGDAPANTTFTADYQPTDNQSQQLALMAVWES